jgi:hypothetical protein
MDQSSARWLRRGLQTLGIAAAVSALLLLGLFIAEISRLPSIHSLLVYLPDQAGELPPQLCIEQPVQALPVSSALPLKPALLAAEGTRGHYSGQIARTLMCNSHRTNLRRELDELLLAVEIDHSFSLDQRLTIYLNRLYLGEGQIGVASASRHYFGKTVDQLSLPDRALLMGMAKSPAYFAPASHPDRALDRRNSVLIGMVQQGSISTAEGTAAETSPLLVSQ